MPAIAGALALTAATAHAQPVESDESAYAVDSITVTTTRTSQGRPLSSIPGSVTVIDREAIEEQALVSDDFAEILTNLVPGMGPSSESLTSFGQQLRGRDVLVLIDGVPQTTPLRDVSKGLRLVDPATVERIEVIRGSVATYGYGATGGIINIITRSGADAPEGVSYRTEVGATGSLTHVDDSLGAFLSQSIIGRSGATDFAFTATAEDRGAWFDPDGERIPPDAFGQGGGLAETREYNLQGKVGRQLTEDQRLQLSVSYHTIRQDSAYRGTPGDPASGEPAGTERGDVPGKNPGIDNISVTLDHTAENLFGGTLSSQLYYQNFETIFSYYPPTDSQSFLESEKFGARVAHERGFIGDSTIIYGVDLLRDRTVQPLVGGGLSTPPIEQLSYAPFAQVEVPVGRDWLLRGGVRHERAHLDVDDYTTTFISPRTVEGGELDYDETVFNIGAVYFLDQNQELFASFSQGFSVADIGRVLRGTSAQSVEEIEPDAQVVDNYEIGWRGEFDRISASAAVFYNTSDLGSTYTTDLRLQRQKEEIYGVELTADWRATERWTFGGAVSWQEGKADSDDDGDVDAYLPATRISPAKVTMYGEYEPSDRWNLRLQATHFRDRDHDDYLAVFGSSDIEGFTLVDLGASVAAGPGRIRFGVNNLLNEEYITPLGQIYGDAGSTTGFVAGQGRSFTLSYAVEY
jgi:iron complex outermembrane receptor protein